MIAFCTSYVLLVGLTLTTVDANSSWGPKALVVGVGLLYVLLGGLLAYRVFVHARVTADASGLRIANPFRRDQEVRWDEIVSMKADRLLLIQCVDGRDRVAWVIQKNGWSRLRHERTDADEAIDELGRLAGRALKTGPRDFAAIAAS